MRKLDIMANYIIQERNICDERVEYAIYYKKNALSSYKQVFTTDKVVEAYRFIIDDLLSKQKITFAFVNSDGSGEEYSYMNDFKINLDRFFNTDSDDLIL